MKVKVAAPFELRAQLPDGTVDVPEGTRVRDLLRLAEKPPLFARLLPVSVNGAQSRRDDLLHEGDVVVFILPIRGG